MYPWAGSGCARGGAGCTAMMPKAAVETEEKRSEATAEVCLVVGRADCDETRSNQINQIRSDLADVAWNGNARYSRSGLPNKPRGLQQRSQSQRSSCYPSVVRQQGAAAVAR